MRTLTAIALALTLWGCGGGGGGQGATPSAPVPAPPPPPPAPPPPPPAPAPGPNAYAPGPAAQPTTGVALPLGKCLNLSNMLDAPNEGDWGRLFEDADAMRIRQRGFASVRVPVRFSAHALAGPPYTIDPAFMARARHVVDALLDQGLNVIVDMHHYEEIFTDPLGQQERFAELWRQVAAEFADAPDTVWFELINEPHDQLDDTNLAAVLTPALAAVRATNPSRPVVVGGQNYSGVDSLATVQFPDDANLVATFHYYDPFAFTHQGAPWIVPVQPTGRVFGTAADNAQLEEALRKVRDFMDRTGRVPFIGEYGAYENIPLGERAAYYRTISAAFASIGVQSCAWGYTNTFHLRRDDTGWIASIVDGISTTTTLR